MNESESDVMSWVTSLEHSLLPCLPARELQAMDRAAHPSRQADVELHVKEFMDSARKLQTFFISLHHKHQPGKQEALSKEIEALEEELKEKNELLEMNINRLKEWRGLLTAQKKVHVDELDSV